MIRVVSTGDWHITDGPRLADQAATLAKMIDVVEAGPRPDLWLVGGDIYGMTVPHRSTPAERAVCFPAIVRMAEIAPVVVISGNHDHEVDMDGIRHLSGDYPIRVVTGLSDPSEFVVPVATRGGPVEVYCLPYPSKKHLLAAYPTLRGVQASQDAAARALAGLLQSWGARIKRARADDPSRAHVGLMHIQVDGVETSGGEVLDGQEVAITRTALEAAGFDYVSLHHIHKRQEAGRRARYPGAPWRNDFGETDERGYAIVSIGADVPSPTYADPGRLPVQVDFHATDCRRFVTLTYRWDTPSDGAAPMWVVRPSAAELASAADAEVRMVCTVPEAHTASCPWDAEVARVSAMAVRVKLERKTEPTLRVRAQAVADARTQPEQAREFWAVTADPPNADEQAEALDCLSALAHGDDVIAADLRALGGM